MNYKTRISESKLQSLLESFPVVAVVGARQTGKTTLINNTLPADVECITFEPSEDVALARQDPGLFFQQHRGRLFLDEIQYSPQVLPLMKKIVDTNQIQGQFILSGSQQFTVMKDLAESLAGRIGFLDLWPMTVREFSGQVTQNQGLYTWLQSAGSTISPAIPPAPPTDSLNTILWRGLHPRLLTMNAGSIPSYWEGYLRTYLEKDLRSLSQLGDIHQFRQFMGLLAGLTAQELNYTHLGREIDVQGKTARHWLSLAETGFQVYILPAFSRNQAKTVSGKPKMHLSDTGLACSLMKISQPSVLDYHPLRGSLFESFMVMEIVKQIQAWPSKPAMYHFRSYTNSEVDLILEYNGKLFPIEFKFSSKPIKRDCSGFHSLRNTYPNESIAPGIIFCGTDQPILLNQNGDRAVPWWWV